MDWTLLVGIASVIVTNLVTIITLYIHLDNKTENRLGKMQDMMNVWQQRSESIIIEMRTEMKDFHGRLCAIEERNRNSYTKKETLT